METAPNAAPSAAGGPAGFTKLISSTVTEVISFRNSRDCAVELGVDEQALEQYVAGACSLYERNWVKAMIAKNDWALRYVTDLVKSNRK